MSEHQSTPNRRYYDLMAWLLLAVIAADLGVIGYRKYLPVDLKVDRTARMDFPLQVDPNTAAAFDLQCLPGINKKMAQAIVEYRMEFQSRFPGRIVFPGPEALRRVKGISDKKLLQLVPYLIFPKPNLKTRPAS